MANFLASKKGKRLMGMVYGLGAAVVIVGALFKILHWPGANEMLTVGLLTEAVIFAISAFEKPHEDPDWSLVYPELAGGEAKARKVKTEDATDAQGLLSQKLDAMLKEAKQLGGQSTTTVSCTLLMRELEQLKYECSERVSCI